jgi:hypothetical protein
VNEEQHKRYVNYRLGDLEGDAERAMQFQPKWSPFWFFFNWVAGWAR